MLKALKFAGALVAALVVLEVALRLAGVLVPRSYGPAGPGDTILFAGDSHVRSLVDGAGFSLPDRLRELLEKRYANPVVVNAGALNENTSELLARLEREFRAHHPKVLVLLAGEANFWNLHHLHLFLDGKPTLAGFFGQLRLANLLGAGAPAFPAPRAGYSTFFLDVPLAEYPTLAMRWAGYLDARRGQASLSADDAAEAEYALRRWLADPRSGESPLAARALVDLLRGRHAPEDARKVEEQALADNLRNRAELFHHPERLAGIPERAGEAAKKSSPEAARALLREAFRLNPFPAGEPPNYEFYQYLTPADFVALLTEAFPPAIGPNGKPGIDLLRESFLDSSTIPAWVARDLGVIVRFARDHGAAVLLATYPPERFSGRSREADTVIRRVAEARGVPLSDISAELRRRWDGRALDQFYGTPGLPVQDDHLNRAGNELAAGIIVDDLVRFHLVD